MLLRLRYITGQWHNQPKNWGGKMFDFRRITLFCLEKRFSFRKMTVCSRNLEGRAPLVGLSYAYVTGHGPVGRFLVSSGRAGLQQCWSVRSLDVGGKRIFYKKFASTRKGLWPADLLRQQDQQVTQACTNENGNFSRCECFLNVRFVRSSWNEICFSKLQVYAAAVYANVAVDLIKPVRDTKSRNKQQPERYGSLMNLWHKSRNNMNAAKGNTITSKIINWFYVDEDVKHQKEAL